VLVVKKNWKKKRKVGESECERELLGKGCELSVGLRMTFFSFFCEEDVCSISRDLWIPFRVFYSVNVGMEMVYLLNQVYVVIMKKKIVLEMGGDEEFLPLVVMIIIKKKKSLPWND